MGIEHIARVNPKYFAAIELFAANRDPRYYLNGVYIEPHREKGVVIVATNGHMLGAFHDPDGWCEKGIIVGDISKQLIAACVKPGTARNGGIDTPLALIIGQEFAIVSSEFGTPDSAFDRRVLHACRISILDGKYPDWRRVVDMSAKNSGNKGVGELNPAYLSVLNKVAQRAERSKYGCTRLYGAGDERGTIIARLAGAEIDERFIALIMPMRGSLPADKALPDAFAPIPLPAPKAKPRVRQTAEGWVNTSTSKVYVPEVANV